MGKKLYKENGIQFKTFDSDELIEAEQFDGSDEMIKKYGLIKHNYEYGRIVYPYLLPTLEGNLDLYIDDWIATGSKGEHWAIADEVFKENSIESFKKY